MLTALLNRLRRETTSGRFVGEIDGLRFYAILAVLLFHVDGSLLAYRPWLRPDSLDADWLYTVTRAGHYGVQLFFVLSGFVLGMPFAEAVFAGGKRVSLPAYLQRRVTRLEPPYLINLTVMALLLILVNGALPEKVLPRYLASLFYVDSWLFGYPILVNFVAWSLEIEVQFYLLAPFLASIFHTRPARTRRLALLGAIILAPAAIHAGGLDDWHQGRTVLHNLPFFLSGFLIVDVWMNDWKRHPSRSVAWDFLGVCCCIGLITMARYEYSLPPSLVAVVLAALCAGIVVSGFRGAFQQCILPRGLLPAVGGMCYTIYLWHPAIKSSLCKAAAVIPTLPSALLERTLLLSSFVAIVIMCSVPFYLLFEKPFMRRDWPQRFMARLSRHRMD
jgi:peptidoglycan/LPS O-acetylase OafA/YrhL